MNTKEEILTFLDYHQNELSQKYHLTKLGLFGSFARGEEQDGSDVDILIEMEEGTSNVYELKKSLHDFLVTSFQRDVDIARIKYLKPYAKDMILKDAIYVR